MFFNQCIRKPQIKFRLDCTDLMMIIIIIIIITALILYSTIKSEDTEVQRFVNHQFIIYKSCSYTQ